MNNALKYLLAILCLATGVANAQETPPSGLKQVNSQLYINLADSAIWHNKGVPYGWERLGRYRDVMAVLRLATTKADSAAVYIALATKISTNSNALLNSVILPYQSTPPATPGANTGRIWLNQFGALNITKADGYNRALRFLYPGSVDMRAPYKASSVIADSTDTDAKILAEKSARQSGDNNLSTRINQDSMRIVNEAARAIAVEALKANQAAVGATNGIAQLDMNGKVPLAQMNDALLGSVNYQGGYNPITNSPALPAAASSNKGYYWISTQKAYNSLVTDTLRAGDWIISNGSAYTKVDNNNAVTRVNNQTGNVNLTTANIPEGTNLYYTNTRAAAAALVAALTGINTTATGTITQTSTVLQGIGFNAANLAAEISRATGVENSLSGNFANYYTKTQSDGNYILASPGSAQSKNINITGTINSGAITATSLAVGSGTVSGTNGNFSSSSIATLSVTSILQPPVDNVVNIGASGNRFANIYAGGTVYTPNLNFGTSSGLTNAILKTNPTGSVGTAQAGTDYLAPASTYYIGTTNLAFNRASASQTLTGVSIDGHAGLDLALTGGTITGNTNIRGGGSGIFGALTIGDSGGGNVWSIGRDNQILGDFVFGLNSVEKARLSTAGNLSVAGTITGVNSIQVGGTSGAFNFLNRDNQSIGNSLYANSGNIYLFSTVTGTNLLTLNQTSGNLSIVGAGTFGGTVSAIGPEVFRGIHSSAFISGYNTGNTTRTGYLQFNSGADITLRGENVSNIYIGVNGAQLQVSSGGVNVNGNLSVAGTGTFSNDHYINFTTSTIKGYHIQASGTEVANWLYNSGTGEISIKGQQSYNFLNFYAGGLSTPSLSLATNGNASFSNNLSVAGQIISTLTNSAYQAAGNSSTTNYVYQYAQNSGGFLQYGVENSAGNNLAVGALPYAAIISQYNNKALQLATNNTVRMTIDGGGNTIFNGALNSSISKTTINGSTTGYIECSMPYQGASYKKVVIYMYNLKGNATYTFPVPFTDSGRMNIWSPGAPGAIQAADNTSITLGGSTQVGGMVFIEGY